MASSPYLTDRAMGVWGPRAYAWTGEVPPRVLVFPYESSGHQPVPGPRPDPRPARGHWFRALAHPRWPGRGQRPGVS
jgi:hypothetical protein